jgi:hypothetical protein
VLPGLISRRALVKKKMSLLITAMLSIFSAKDLTCPLSTEKLPT